MLPILKAFPSNKPLVTSEIRDRVAASEKLTDSDIREMIPSGRQSKFVNRVSWAVIHMVRAGLLERIRRGEYQLTEEGSCLLASSPSHIDIRLLKQYPKFQEWKASSSNDDEPKTTKIAIDTPEETLDRAIDEFNSALAAEVLQLVRDAKPEFLELVIVDLLISMGYGGGDSTMGQVTGGSGDGGIDGRIKEDALGLDEVYVQAKKYGKDSTVGAGDLRNFAGAIDTSGTTKGVFVTTAKFTQSAINYVKESPKRIVLIDGNELARLMVFHNVGVRTDKSYTLKQIDQNYFGQNDL